MLKKKLKIFAQLMWLKKKVTDSQHSGAGNEEVYESHLFYFSEFSFLDGVIVLRKTQNNFSLDDTLERAMEAVEGVQATADVLALSQSTSKPMQIASARQSSGWRGGSTSSSSARSARYEDAIAAIVQSTNSRPERKTKYESFGTSVASQLEELSNIEAAEAMAELQQVLSRHVIQSLQRRSIASHSSLSSSVEGSDLLQSAMINSDLFDEF